WDRTKSSGTSGRSWLTPGIHAIKWIQLRCRQSFNGPQSRVAFPGFALQFKFANLNRYCITPWCNGNTAPFGGVIHGSNPCGVAYSESRLMWFITRRWTARVISRVQRSKYQRGRTWRVYQLEPINVVVPSWLS